MQNTLSPPFISAIIVNYNAGAMLRECITSLLTQHFTDFEIWIVDNASSDNSLADAKTLLAGTKLHYTIIENSTNVGFAAANNQAASHAQGSWLALLNPDTIAKPDWLAQLVHATETYPDIDMFGSLQLFAEDETQLDGCGDCYHITGFPYRGHHGYPADTMPATGEVFAPCAAAGLYLKSHFLELGGFYEPFFCYCEDVDLAFRMRLSGSRCMQIQEAIVSHHGSAITDNISGFSVFHGTRNAMWMFVKNMPLALMLLLFPLHMATHGFLLINAIGKPSFTPRLKGILHGLAGIPRILLARRKIKRHITINTLLHSMACHPRYLAKRLTYMVAKKEIAS